MESLFFIYYSVSTQKIINLLNFILLTVFVSWKENKNFKVLKVYFGSVENGGETLKIIQVLFSYSFWLIHDC